MAVRPLRPGDLVYSFRRTKPAFGLVVAVEKPDPNDPDNPELYWHYHVVVDERLIRTHEVSIWTLVQG